MKKIEAVVPAAGGFFGGFALGVGIGVVLMYVLDPDKGSDRRAMIKDKATSLGQDGLEWSGKTWESLRGKTEKVSSSIPTSFQSIQ